MKELPSEVRKQYPVGRFLQEYFPDAIMYLAHLSWAANEQHNPGEPMHWAREKSTDHSDCAARHFLDAGTLDSDGLMHTGKAAWRMLAMLQLELEETYVNAKSRNEWVRSTPQPAVHAAELPGSLAGSSGYLSCTCQRCLSVAARHG